MWDTDKRLLNHVGNVAVGLYRYMRGMSVARSAIALEPFNGDREDSVWQFLVFKVYKTMKSSLKYA
jgi:hypothetical protein